MPTILGGRLSPFAKLIRGSWFAKVVIMPERVMSESSSEQIRELLDSLYRVDSGRILATRIRLLGDSALAEAIQDRWRILIDSNYENK